MWRSSRPLGVSERDAFLWSLRRAPPGGGLPALRDAREELRADREIVLEAVKRDGRALQYASEDLRADKDVVLQAVERSAGFVPKDGEQILMALQYASEELRADRDFVLEAAKRNGRVLQYASEELRADRDFVLEVVKQNGGALSYASFKLRAERDVVLEAVKQNGEALFEASMELRGNRDVVLEAVKQSGQALRFASFKLRADRDVVLEAVKQSGQALRDASKELRADRDVVLEAVKQDGQALCFASAACHTAEDLALLAVRRQPFMDCPSQDAQVLWRSQRFRATIDTHIAVIGEGDAPTLIVGLSRRDVTDGREEDTALSCEASFMSGNTFECIIRSDTRRPLILNDLAEKLVEELRTQGKAAERVFIVIGDVFVTPWDWERPLTEFLEPRS